MNKKDYKSFFYLHYRPLCNLAWRIVRDLDEAEDVVQEVFIKVWNIRETLDDKNNVKSYIYTMVRNQALDSIKKKATKLRIISEIAAFRDEVEKDQFFESDVDKYLLIDQLYVSIRQLPPKCREVFTLSKIKGLTYSQIAEKMNISVKTVENHIGKGLKILRQNLGNQMPYILIIILQSAFINI